MRKPSSLREQYGILEVLNAGSSSDSKDRHRLMQISYLGRPLGAPTARQSGQLSIAPRRDAAGRDARNGP